LEDISYRSIDELCKNVKIVCDLEIIDALSEIDFPANKNDIMDYVRFRNFSEFVVRAYPIYVKSFYRNVSII